MRHPNRKRLRLPQYDYSTPGAYFITICVQHKRCLFEAEYVGNGLCAVPSAPNQMLRKWLDETQRKFGISIDHCVIMPNHLHLLVRIGCEEPFTFSQTERHAGRSLLENAMRWFKTMTTNDYIREVKRGNFPPFHDKLWQKSYYDHIVRGQEDYDTIVQYIANNPARWNEDHFYIQTR